MDELRMMIRLLRLRASGSEEGTQLCLRICIRFLGPLEQEQESVYGITGLDDGLTCRLLIISSKY